MLFTPTLDPDCHELLKTILRSDYRDVAYNCCCQLVHVGCDYLENRWDSAWASSKGVPDFSGVCTLQNSQKWAFFSYFSVTTRQPNRCETAVLSKCGMSSWEGCYTSQQQHHWRSLGLADLFASHTSSSSEKTMRSLLTLLGSVPTCRRKTIKKKKSDVTK